MAALWKDADEFLEREIGCEGDGGCVIVSQDRQENFSRRCWITFH
jgi:hypothetical protein